MSFRDSHTGWALSHLSSIQYDQKTHRSVCSVRKLPQIPLNSLCMRRCCRAQYELPYQPIPNTYTAELRHLIMSMLITCPAQRPTAAQLLRSPYLQRALRTSQAIKRKSYAQLSALVSESYLAK